MYETITFEIMGISPLRMHNKQLADPSNKWVKLIKSFTSKGSDRTDAQNQALSDAEWNGGLYLDENLRPCIPGECVEAALKVAAVHVDRKKGKQKFKAGVFCDGMFPINYGAARPIDELRSDSAFRVVNQMKVGKARVMRTRPHFQKWSAKVVVHFNPEVVDRAMVVAAMNVVGPTIGILEDRPRCGRFEAKVA